MNLGDLRKTLAELAELPDDMPVKYIAKNGTVKPVDAIRWSPVVDGGGIAIWEKDKNK